MPAECHKCGKYFDFGNYKVDEHSLRQHMQVKRLIYTFIILILKYQGARPS